MGTFLISCEMPRFSLIFMTLQSVQGDKRYEREVEEHFIFLLCIPRAPRYPSNSYHSELHAGVIFTGSPEHISQ